MRKNKDIIKRKNLHTYIFPLISGDNEVGICMQIRAPKSNILNKYISRERERDVLSSICVIIQYD